MCSCLLSMQVQLQRMWDEKGAKLDQVVQLRKYEHDSSQVCVPLQPATVATNDVYCPGVLVALCSILLVVHQIACLLADEYHRNVYHCYIPLSLIPH